MSVGYFSIGIENNKWKANIGTLWRSAYCFDAALLFTIHRRYERQPSDTPNAAKHIPLQHFDSFDTFYAALPAGAVLIGVEFDDRAIPLRHFHHPERAVYLLGAEDAGLSAQARAACQQLVVLPGRMSVNVAVAGSLVMAHRVMQREREAALLKQAPENVRRQMPIMSGIARFGT